MKRLATINGYSLKFHPTQPLAFALPNSSEVSVVSTVDWKPVGKLPKLKKPRELCFTDDAIVVSGFEGHIGVYDEATLACRTFFKLQNTINDDWGLFVDPGTQFAGLAAFEHGVRWVNCLTKEIQFRFQPHNETGMLQHTCFICKGTSPEQLITICRQFGEYDGELAARSIAYVWNIHDEKPIKYFEVMRKPSINEYVDHGLIGFDNLLIVSVNQNNGILGWNLDSGTLVFDNPELRHGANSGQTVFATLPQRRLIAVGSNGFVDFWSSDMSIRVHRFDSGNRLGFYGEMTVSNDEKYLACSTGKLSVYELPVDLQGP